MELRHLRYFLAVVEAGSLTAAAKALHMSQPPLSVAIAQLETELGTPLLVRTSRGVEPTSAGRSLLESSGRVLGEVDEIVATVRRSAGRGSGVLTVAAVPALIWHRIPRLLREVASGAPDLEIRLVDPPPWTAIDLVVNGRADVAAILVADPKRFVARHGDAFEIRDWGAVPLVAALPPGTEAPDPLPLHWFDDRIVLLPQRTAAVPSLPELVEAEFLRLDVVPREVRTVPTIQNMVPLVEAGLGAALLPDADRASVGRFDIVVRATAPSPAPLRALVIARRGAAADPVVGSLLELVSATSADSVVDDPDRVRFPIQSTNAREDR
ncbi:LysR family transcriptional regulator [Agromyces sp. NPDC057679]|uniref:LysR family transcriptional regulator n=1 Tax=Agromyces sp. NPDC057679 TaxID=3346207 RepID=UPI00366B7DFF